MKNSLLEGIFSEEEIQKAVFGSYADGAPGPDGLSFLFYQQFWDVVVVGSRQMPWVWLRWGRMVVGGIRGGFMHSRSAHARTHKNTNEEPRKQEHKAHHDVPCFGALSRR